jgi:hypothetical protein
MSADNTTDGSTDGLQALVRAWAEAVYNDPGETPMPMASTNEYDVIRAQLTENTGTHFLDSGSAMGRHHEKNAENPPWERPAWAVNSEWVTHNVYHYMHRVLSRDWRAVALEAALYAYGHNGPGEGESWLSCMEGFAKALPEIERYQLDEMGVRGGFAENVLGYAHRVRSDADRNGVQPPLSFNTYNQGNHTLSQCLQGTVVGGPHGDYVFLQVHQGADVRGGYTGPRVYATGYSVPMPMELEFRCDKCDWVGYESVVKRGDQLAFHPDEQHPEDPDSIGGWVEHQPVEDETDPNYCGGLVRFS